jgi:lia operon protein LiaG
MKRYAILLAAILLPAFGFAAGEETERSFDMSGINNLILSYRTGDVTIALTGGNSLVIKERLRRMESAEVETSGGTLRVTGAKTPWFLGWTARNITHIAVPRSFGGDLYIEIRSGTLRAADDFSTAGDAEIILRSGIVEMRRLEAKKISLRVSSGTFRSRGLYGESRVMVSSGSFTCDELEGSAHRVEVSSGRLTVRRGRGSFDGSVMSGTIDLEMAELEGDISLNARSGRVRLALPEDAAFNLDAETSSGSVSLHSKNGGYEVKNRSSVVRPIGENPRHTVFTRVTSGNIEITR